MTDRPGLQCARCVRLVAGLLLLSCLVPVLWAPDPAAAAETLTISGYLGRVEAARDVAREGRSAPSRERMRQVRTRLGLPLTVTMPGGQQVEIPPDPVLEGLEGDRAADFEAAADRLGKLADAAGRAEADPGVGLDQVPDALRSAYRGIATRPTITQRMGAWVALMVSRLWRFLSDGLSRASFLSSLVELVAVGLLVVLIVWVAVRVVRQVGLVPGRERVAPEEGAERVDWAQAAEEALARGEAREAVRALYRVLVEALAERSLVPDLPSLTPAECRTAVRRRSAEHPVPHQGAEAQLGVHAGLPGFGRGSQEEREESELELLSWAIDRATASFERVVYGRDPPTPADVEVLREAGRAARATRAA